VVNSKGTGVFCRCCYSCPNDSCSCLSAINYARVAIAEASVE